MGFCNWQKRSLMVLECHFKIDNTRFKLECIEEKMTFLLTSNLDAPKVLQKL